MHSLKKHIPWWLKITSKIVLSRLPIQYRLWKRMRLFEHGYMDTPSYAYSVFMQHFTRTKMKPGFVCLELGPGDTLYSALIGKATGAGKIFLVDTACDASRDMKGYKAMCDFLLKRGHCFSVDLNSYDNMMKSCNARYLTCGLCSLRVIPDDSVDFAFSQAVFEHIRKGDFVPTLKELCRVMKPNAYASHVVDLRDHLGGALNNLRFSNKLWESDFFANSGFYTNRITYSEMIHAFEMVGFQYEVVDKKTWKELPIAEHNLHADFRRLPLHDLAVASFTVVLTPHGRRGKLQVP